MKTLLKASAIVALSASSAAAQFITPTGTFSATLPPGVTFGGSGIPGPVMTTSLNNVELVIGASQRSDNAALTNNGAGTYFAVSGTDISSTPVANSARWNFNYAITGTQRLAYNYRVFYDFNPAAGNTQNQASYGFFNLPSALLDVPVVGVPSQNSLNLGMAFLSGPAVPGFLTPPPVSFSALADGTYSFALVAYTPGISNNGINPYATEVGRVAMDVNMSAVPEPSTYAQIGRAHV